LTVYALSGHQLARMKVLRILPLLFFAAMAAQAGETLSLADVQQIFSQAISYATSTDPDAVIAVVDREGFVLGVWSEAGVNPVTGYPSQGEIAAAIDRAGTATFLSSNQDAFTSRTAGYILQQHFPPGVNDTPPGPLVGVGFSNLFFSDVNRFKGIPPNFSALNLAPNTVQGAPGDPTTHLISPGVAGNQVPFSSLDDSPGGVPLYKNGSLVGGIGVTGDGRPTNLCAALAIIDNQMQQNSTSGFEAGKDNDEDVALAGQTGYRPSDDILASNVLINGIRIPYVYPTSNPSAGGGRPLGSVGSAVPGYPVQGSPLSYPYPSASFGGLDGEIRAPIRADPLPGTINGVYRLSADDVEGIISLAAKRCSETQSGIRLPLGTPAQVFITVVNNPFENGVAPAVLGTFRVGEATMFSWDVSVQKARTAVFFSNNQLAQSCRTIGFLAERWFPPGIEGQPWGPYFGFQEAVSLKTSASVPHTYPGDPNLPNGITIFPGGFPLYNKGQLVGAIGVSGDGVDEDDIISASGCANFLPPQTIEADFYTYQGVRLPYAKFPRNPSPTH
jgi:uncharacterized protein GlcG (DUF336 family)